MLLEKYLPIGTVVMLDGGEKRVMITGFACTSDNEPDVVYDYMGCLYPEGIVNTNESLLFNHDQIVKLYHLGLIDEEEEEFMDDLEDLLEEGNAVEAEAQPAADNAATTQVFSPRLATNQTQNNDATAQEGSTTGGSKSFFG